MAKQVKTPDEEIAELKEERKEYQEQVDKINERLREMGALKVRTKKSVAWQLLGDNKTSENTEVLLTVKSKAHKDGLTEDFKRNVKETHDNLRWVSASTEEF